MRAIFVVCIWWYPLSVLTYPSKYLIMKLLSSSVFLGLFGPSRGSAMKLNCLKYVVTFCLSDGIVDNYCRLLSCWCCCSRLSVVMVVVCLVPDAAKDTAGGNAFEMNFSNLKLIQLKPLQLFFGWRGVGVVSHLWVFMKCVIFVVPDVWIVLDRSVWPYLQLPIE